MRNYQESKQNQYREQNNSENNSFIQNKDSHLNDANYQYYPTCFPTFYQFPNVMYQQSQIPIIKNQQQVSNEKALAQPVSSLTAIYPYPQYYASYPSFVQAAMPFNVASGGYQMCMLTQGISLPYQQNCSDYQKQKNLQTENLEMKNLNTQPSDLCMNEHNQSNIVKIEGSQSIEIPQSSTRSIQMQIISCKNQKQDHKLCLKHYSEETCNSQNTYYQEKSETLQYSNKNHKKNKNQQSFLNKRKQLFTSVDKSTCKCNTINEYEIENESPRKMKKTKTTSQSNKQTCIQNKTKAHIQQQFNQQNQSNILNSQQSQPTNTVSTSKPKEKYNMKFENSIQRVKQINKEAQNEIIKDITEQNQQKYKPSQVLIKPEINSYIFQGILDKNQNQHNFIEQHSFPEVNKKQKQNSLSSKSQTISEECQEIKYNKQQVRKQNHPEQFLKTLNKDLFKSINSNLKESYISSEMTHCEENQTQITRNSDSIQIKTEDGMQTDHEISIDFDDIKSIDIENNHTESPVNKKINIPDILKEFSYSYPKEQKQKKSSKQSSKSSNSDSKILKKQNKQLKRITEETVSDENKLNSSSQLLTKKQQKTKQKNLVTMKPTLTKQESVQSENNDNADQLNSNTEYSNDMNEYMKKGNCVKNIIKAFQNWCKDEVTDDTIISQYPGYDEDELSADQIRKKINRYLKNKIPNHQNFQRLVDHPKFGKILHYFIQKPALDWIASSQIKNKDQHIQFINLLCEKWENPDFFEGFIKILKRKKNLVTNKLLLDDKFYDQEISS